MMPAELSLEAQIEDARRTISSDGYPMSIGELTNLFRDGELNVRPEFQRFFRWTQTQKSRLVESLLLGIPLPSIFVAQAKDGVWELVDGLQRISTILELQGLLPDREGKMLPPLTLIGTKYLPALEGRVWEGSDESKSLSNAQRLDIKRTKIDVKIIKRESSPRAKYDLFQRLNSFGTIATAQEMRNPLILSASPPFFAELEEMSRYEPFISSCPISDRLEIQKYDLELLLRWLLLHDRPEDKLTQQALRDFPSVLDDEAIELAEGYPASVSSKFEVFKATFDLVQGSGGENVFRRWDAEKGEFRGPFLTSAFEVFGCGIGYHLAAGTAFRTDIEEAVKEFWQLPQMKSGYATGRSTEARLADFIPLGRQFLSV